MSQALPPNGSIHGISSYINYRPVIDFTVMQAFIPFLYIIPTMGIMIAILVKYARSKASMSSVTMDHNIFAFIMFYFLFNTLFFFGDYFHLNLPTSGLVTSWCAGIEPNRFFGVYLVFAYFCNYGTIICPFMVCVMRLTIMLSPRNNERYCRLIMYRFAIPFLFIVPAALTFFNISAIGYCKQLDSPFTLGSLIIYEGEEMARLNIFIHFSFSCVIFTSNVSMSIFMFYKLRMTHVTSTSARTKELTRKAEFSLFLAVVSSVVPFITNSICSVTFLLDRPRWYYVLWLRPIGNDYETTMMPWVLFITHPMFNQKKKKLTPGSLPSNINTTSQSRTSQNVLTLP